ncbi:MAG: 5-formyltetrahydrofolate cyclo-ligase [Saprospiraceae bacterium]|nr:5-formyltetrahydrofolate cyclo-ligase [Saprospiraceae bacterium]
MVAYPIFATIHQMAEVISLKEKIRIHYISIRSKIPQESRERWSQETCNLLIKTYLYRKISVVHSFIPFGPEINILPFLQFCLDQDTKVVTPKVQKRPILLHLTTPDLTHLAKNKFGIWETTSSEIYTGCYDLILVPGTVFDFQGYRVGYGGGYYDFFLAQHPEALKIGVGFPLQLVKELPHEVHDIPVDHLILGDQTIEVKR